MENIPLFTPLEVNLPDWNSSLLLYITKKDDTIVYGYYCDNKNKVSNSYNTDGFCELSELTDWKIATNTYSRLRWFKRELKSIGVLKPEKLYEIW